LGSIARGLDFVENSLKTLKPGGLAIHTTEYNYLATDHTISSGPTVLFLKKHFEILASRIKAAGHNFIGPTFDTGNGCLDNFVDLPPYAAAETVLKLEQSREINNIPHLKLSIHGYASTCYGILIKKKQD
jgi:hypothetical protein